jgi:hypothetical protein
MKSKDIFNSKRVNKRPVIKVFEQFIIPAITRRTRFRAFILKVPLIKRVHPAIKH